jgi:hypothetical protein
MCSSSSLHQVQWASREAGYAGLPLLSDPDTAAHLCLWCKLLTNAYMSQCTFRLSTGVTKVWNSFSQERKVGHVFLYLVVVCIERVYTSPGIATSICKKNTANYRWCILLFRSEVFFFFWWCQQKPIHTNFSCLLWFGMCGDAKLARLSRTFLCVSSSSQL